MSEAEGSLEERDWEVLRAAHRAMFRHPAAMQAALSALAAEGRRYAQTPEGAELKARLAESEIMHRARVLWSVTTMGVFEDEPDVTMPSAILESICRVATSTALEAHAVRLMEELNV